MVSNDTSSPVTVAKMLQPEYTDREKWEHEDYQNSQL